MARVLIVNDEQDLMEACGMALEALGHEPIVAPHAQLAARLAAEARPDLVLLDLVVPGTTGEALLKLIQEQIGSVPVVVMSASEDGPDRAKRMGAEAFLTKPFGEQALGSAVDLALRATTGQHALHVDGKGRASVPRR